MVNITLMAQFEKDLYDRLNRWSTLMIMIVSLFCQKVSTLFSTGYLLIPSPGIIVDNGYLVSMRQFPTKTGLISCRVDHFHKCVHYPRVEIFSGFFLDMRQCFFFVPSRAIWTIAGDRVPHIHNRENTGG